MLLLAIFTEALDWGWTSVWQSILVNVGTSMLLAAVLFLAEPRFTRRVIKAAGQGVSEQVRAAVEENTGHLTRRLDDFESILMKRKKDEASIQEAVVDAVEDDVSHRTISQALDEANRVGAVGGGGIVVRAAPTLQGPFVEFRYVQYNDGQWPGRREGEVALEVYVQLEKRPGEIGTPVIMCDWNADMSAEDVDAELRQRLQAAGYWEFSNALNFAFALKEFTRGLKLALASSRSDPAGGTLKGALYQLVNEEWAITEAGIECPMQNYIFPESDFPEKYQNPLGPDNRPPFLPAAPSFVDDDTWSYLIEKGKAYFPTPRARGFYTPTFSPYSGSTDRVSGSSY